MSDIPFEGLSLGDMPPKSRAARRATTQQLTIDPNAAADDVEPALFSAIPDSPKAASSGGSEEEETNPTGERVKGQSATFSQGTLNSQEWKIAKEAYKESTKWAMVSGRSIISNYLAFSISLKDKITGAPPAETTQSGIIIRMGPAGSKYDPARCSVCSNLELGHPPKMCKHLVILHDLLQSYNASAPLQLHSTGCAYRDARPYDHLERRGLPVLAKTNGFADITRYQENPFPTGLGTPAPFSSKALANRLAQSDFLSILDQGQREILGDRIGEMLGTSGDEYVARIVGFTDQEEEASNARAAEALAGLRGAGEKGNKGDGKEGRKRARPSGMPAERGARKKR